MKKRILILFSTLLVAGGFGLIPFACKKKKDKEQEYDRTTMLTNIGTQIIVPSYLDVKVQTQTLYTAAQTFTTTPDATNLSALQDAWKTAASSWKRAETYTFAYAGDNSIASKVDAWPTNPTVIESEISGSNTLTESYISATGTTRKGFPAIEYLIYDASGNAAVLDKFTTQSNYQRRQQYLLAVTADIRTKAADTYTSWNPNGANYVSTFISNSSTDAGSSVTLLLNAMVQNLEVVKNEKLGIPLGKKSSGTLHPELVEAKLSAMSISHIKNNLQALENLYRGKANGVDGQGFDDYLTFVKADFDGVPLADKISEQFASCYTAIDAITPPLDNSITAENAKCETAYLELKKLVVLMKLDMSSQLGILITFSDNDGD